MAYTNDTFPTLISIAIVVGMLHRALWWLLRIVLGICLFDLLLVVAGVFFFYRDRIGRVIRHRAHEVL